MRTAKLLASLASVLLLSACGIKGPLFLPEIPPAPLPESRSATPDDHAQDATD